MLNRLLVAAVVVAIPLTLFNIWSFPLTLLFASLTYIGNRVINEHYKQPEVSDAVKLQKQIDDLKSQVAKQELSLFSGPRKGVSLT